MQRIHPIIKKYSRVLRKDLTDAEQLLWRHLRANQLGIKFRRQHSVGRYILDFACISAQLAIELDGGQHIEMYTQDTERTAWLEDKGWRILRFWNNEVFDNVDGVLAHILSRLDASNRE